MNTIQKLVSHLEQRMLSELLETQAMHPLLASAMRSSGNVQQIITAVDVDAPLPATAVYGVPTFRYGFQWDVASGLGSFDQLIPIAEDVVSTIVALHAVDLHRRLVKESADFLSLRAALPPTVGDNYVGGIHESVKSWRSQVVRATHGIYHALITLQERCTRSRKRPDLTIMDGNTYDGFISGFQPVQRFWRVVRGIPMLAFGAGSVYCERLAEESCVYTLHTSDFVFHDSPFEVHAIVTIDGQLRWNILRREQLFPVRRYRSGTVVM